MKQRGNAEKGKRAGAWLLTFVMLLSLVMVPAGKVEAAGDKITVTGANDTSKAVHAKVTKEKSIPVGSWDGGGPAEELTQYTVEIVNGTNEAISDWELTIACSSLGTYNAGWNGVSKSGNNIVVGTYKGAGDDGVWTNATIAAGKSANGAGFQVAARELANATYTLTYKQGESSGSASVDDTATDPSVIGEQSDKVKATFTQRKVEGEYHEYYLKIDNQTSDSISDWIVAIPIQGVTKVEDWSSWARVQSYYTSDYLYIVPVGNAVISANASFGSTADDSYKFNYCGNSVPSNAVVYYKTGTSSGNAFDAVINNANGGSSIGGSTGGSGGETFDGSNIGTIDTSLDYNFAKLLQYSLYFYDANMCGNQVSETSLYSKDLYDGWRGDCHVNDSFTYNGKTYSAVGGYHDAGDHVKFGLPMSEAMTALGIGYYEFGEAFDELGQKQHLKTIVDYYCTYVKTCTVLNATGTEAEAFCYQVGCGQKDHESWCAPEVEDEQKTQRSYTLVATSSNPATDIVGGTAAALALNYLNFGDEEDLKYAKALFAFAKKNEKKRGASDTSGSFYYSDYGSWEDEYCLAAALLYKATNDSDYRKEYNNNNRNTGNIEKPFGWENVYQAASFYAPEINSTEVSTINNWFAGVANANKSQYYCGDSWGSARINCNVQLMMLVYDKQSGTNTYSEWCKYQMSTILGNNSQNRNLVCGYNTNSPTKPHHRAASGYSSWDEFNNNATQKYTLFGALAGGPTSSDFSTYNDKVNDAVSNEVTLDYNAGMVGAAAALYLLYKDSEEAGFTNQTISSDFYGGSNFSGNSGEEVESITLDQETLTLQIGDEKTLTATVIPEAVSTVSWKSSNTKVATVKNGVITGVGVGEATVTATAGDKSVSCQITVTPEPVAILNADALSVTGVTYGNFKVVGEVTIRNSGDGTAAPVSAAFKSGINSNFGLITGDLGAIAQGDKKSITVLLKDNLGAGQYKDVLIVSYFDGRKNQELSIPVSLTVDKRKIAVKADDQTKIFGEKNPKLTYSVTSGSIVKGDSLDVTCSTTATETSEAGSYDITIKAGDNTNYDITCEKGTLTIDKKSITNVLFPTAGDIIEGETLEESPLSDGDTSYGEFAWEDEAAEPVRGIQEANVVLILSDAAKKNYSFDEVEGYDPEKGIITQVVTVNVSRAGLPKITFPTVAEIQIGQSLEAAILQGGSTEYGTFKWEDDTIVPDTAGEYSYNVVFEWSDECKNEYGIVPGDSDETKINKVKVVVKKLDNEKEATSPELVKRTKNTIQVKAEVNHEYSIDNGETWTDEAVGGTIIFDVLKPFTAYTITARIKENETVSASGVSAGLTIYTLVSDPYIIDISNLEDANYVEALCKEGGTSTIEYSDNTLILKENVNYYNAVYTIIGKNPSVTIQAFVDTRIILSDTSMKEVELKGEGNAGLTIDGNVNVTGTIFSDDITDIIISGSGILNASGIITKGVVAVESGTLIVDASNTGLAGIEAEGVVIKGGSVDAIGGKGSPAISSGYGVTVSNGELTAIGGAGAAGIEADEVTITGGTVTVTGGSGNAAGIDANKVTITGGTVSVTGQGDKPAIDADSKNITVTIEEKNGSSYKDPEGSGDPDKEDKKKLVESITVTVPSASIVEGQTATASVEVLPADAADKTVTWSSSNPSVATVSQSGVITAVLEGTADITATAKDGSGKSGRITITVVDNGQGDDKAVQAAGMTVEADVKGVKNIPVKGTFKLAPKKKMELNVIFLPEDAVEEELIFTSSNPKIAKVNEDGVIIAGKKAGKTTITVTSESGLKKTFKVQVMKKPIKKVKIKVSKKVVKVKKKLKLKAVLTPNKKQASNSVYWKSSNPKVATVSASGVVKGMKKGKAKITAVATDGSGKKATVTIQVK